MGGVIGGIVGGIIGVMVLGYIISVFNSLVQVRNNCDKAWENIDVILMQRHDELKKLIDVCSAYMKHERGLLSSLTKLRVGYEEAATPDEKLEAANKLNREVLKLRHAWEGYPDLKASQNFLQIQDRISGLESTISDRREFFNETVNIYNIQIERFPERLVAALFRYKRKDFFEVPEEKKEDVDMSALSDAAAVKGES